MKISIIFPLIFIFQSQAISHLSRHELYRCIVDFENNSYDNEDFFKHIKKNQTYYFELIESSIEKREHDGSKDSKVNSIKILKGVGKILGSSLAYYVLTSFFDTFSKPWIKVPLALGSLCGCINGGYTIYKGIIYKKRMMRKLARDKYVRRWLREITGQI